MTDCSWDSAEEGTLDDGLSGGQIAGIVIGVLIALVLIIVGVRYMRRKKPPWVPLVLLLIHLCYSIEASMALFADTAVVCIDTQSVIVSEYPSCASTVIAFTSLFLWHPRTCMPDCYQVQNLHSVHSIQTLCTPKALFQQTLCSFSYAST